MPSRSRFSPSHECMSPTQLDLSQLADCCLRRIENEAEL